jgi:hypothetical protein
MTNTTAPSLTPAGRVIGEAVRNYVENGQVRRDGATWLTQDRRPGCPWLPVDADWAALLDCLEACGSIVVGTHSGLAAIA